ncbi:DUF3800 domain-containing protein [Leucobacter sp. HY1908]
MAGPISRMIYTDDSGMLEQGWIVYGWLELDARHWDVVLKYWLQFRKRLLATHGLSVTKEIHTSKFVTGRARPVPELPEKHYENGQPRWEYLGRELVELCLQAIRDCPHIEVGAIFRETPARGADLKVEREATYTELVHLWDEQLRTADQYGLVGMDGDGHDPIYYAAHRSLDLPARRIVEDPIFMNSGRSQWIQIADIIAWCSYTHLNNRPDNEFAWNWYSAYLAGLNPMREPLKSE